jgi:hypothetical protein
MSEDALAQLLVCYFAGYVITLLSMDVPDTANALTRRIFLWPLYWVYLVVKMALMLAQEVRR